MDLKLLVGLSLAAALIAACVSVACLVRIEDLHRDFRSGRPGGKRREGALRGRGKVLHLNGDPPRR
ncbi:MAG TPA: hypothetical protein VNT01_02175 [Symbiobacteriaceae bacterium]|nr:hypothetical protein [Symbiobacteriaceae bacterium]